jgi:hypothetical protein
LDGPERVGKDIVWNEGQDPIKDMPTAIMVAVDDYDGPKFPGTNYIPIFPVTRRFQGLSGPYAENVPELTNPGILPALLRIATRCDAPPKHGRPLGVYVCTVSVQ